MTMAPARAVTLIKPHVHGQESQREALPRWGIAALIGYLAYRICWRRTVLAMLGVAAGGHGHESEAAGESAQFPGAGLERATGDLRRWEPCSAGSSPRR